MELPTNYELAFEIIMSISGNKEAEYVYVFQGAEWKRNAATCDSLHVPVVTNLCIHPC